MDRRPAKCCSDPKTSTVEPTDPVILSPPKLIGTDTVAIAINLTPGWVRRLIAQGDQRVTSGYLGKFNGRHIWNAHELFAGLYTSPQALWEEIRRVELGHMLDTRCGVDGCERATHMLQLCDVHIRYLLRVWRRAERVNLSLWHLLALCTWVVERNAHLAPPNGWDPWSNICMTPSCQNRTDTFPGRLSPLCSPCSTTFWSSVERRRADGMSHVVVRS